MKTVFLVSRPLEERSEGTGVSAVAYWLHRKISASKHFHLITQLPCVGIQSYHSLLSIFFYDYLCLLITLFKKRKSLNEIFFVDPSQAFAIVFAKIICKRARVTSLIHDYWIEDSSQRSLYMRYLSILYKISLQRSDVLITTTEENANLIRNSRYYRSSIPLYVMPLGITLNIDNSEKTDTLTRVHLQKAVTIGYLGTSIPRKRLDRLVAIIQHLEHEKIYANVLVGGNISEKFDQELRESARATVHYTNLGRITESQKIAFYKTIDVFVYPTELEGYGLPVIESAFFLKPCVIFSTAQLPKFIKNWCLLIEEDLSNISSTLQKIYSHDSATLSHVQRVSTEVYDLDWHEYVDYLNH